ncbi:MAG TPA: baseplate J/gp47 family protein [Terriglobales bacterium]|nr:baseplate J/gp47 family protein [Terriglobales bacterium]
MATINVRDNQQVIDYLSRDFSSFRKALVDLIPAKLPEWSDRSEADFGVVLIELFAYMGDILSYYQDRLANECFLNTAQERRSVIDHLRLIGYEPQGAAPATAVLSVVVGNDRNGVVEIRSGDQFATATSRDRRSVTFEYVQDKPLLIDLSTLTTNSAHKADGSVRTGFKEATAVIPVREGKTIVNEVIGISDGTANQRYRLAQPNALRESIQIVTDTTPPGPPWRLRKNLAFSKPAFNEEQLLALQIQGHIASTLAFSRNPDRDFAIETDENEVTTVVFGDGQYGEIPPVAAPILATYRTGGGEIGNVGARQITIVGRSPQLQLLAAEVFNPVAASGGAERETIQQAVKYAPTVFSSMQRAVTAEDYVAQARLFPGVSKARAEATNWNLITLYIAPTGDGELPTDILKADLLAYFEDKRMLTTVLEIGNPDYVNIEITVSLAALPFFKASDVQDAVETAIRDLLSFANVEFNETLFLSEIYRVVEAVPGVDPDIFVSRFQRAGVVQDLPGDGRIQMGQNEIPVLRSNDLKLTVRGGV